MPGRQTHGLVTHRSIGDENSDVGTVRAAACQEFGAVLSECRAVAAVRRHAVKARRDLPDPARCSAAPRFLFSDFPLGNAAGRPKDPQSQSFTLELALRLLEAAPAARTTVQSPLRWSEDASWKLDYCNVERLSPAELRRRRAEFDRQKEIAREILDQPALPGKPNRE